MQSPLQPVNVESAVGVAVRVTSVVSSKLVEQVVVHATPVGSEVIVPFPEPALIVANDHVMSNGEASETTPLDRLPVRGIDTLDCGVVELPPLLERPQVMTLPSDLRAANASLVEKIRVTPLDRPVMPVESPPRLESPQVMTLPSVLRAANA